MNYNKFSVELIIIILIFKNFITVFNFSRSYNVTRNLTDRYRYVLTNIYNLEFSVNFVAHIKIEPYGVK